LLSDKCALLIYFSLANYDPLIIRQFQDLRIAQPQDIQSLLESSRRSRSPEPTTTTEEGTSYSEDYEESIDPVSNSDPQSHPTDVDPVDGEGLLITSNLVSHNIATDTTTFIEAAPIFTHVDAEGVNTQSSTDATYSDQYGSSLDRESATFYPAAGETPSIVEAAVAAELALNSPVNPHTVPLPQLDGSELDPLDMEENDMDDDDEVFSADEGVDSGLEPGGLSTDDDTSDDESQAWSLVGDEDTGEIHVSVENEVEELQGGTSSPFDVTHEPHIEHPPVTPEDPSAIVDASFADASSAAQSSPVDNSEPGLDQVISADLDSTLLAEVSDPDGKHSQGSQVEDIHQKHEAGLPLPTPPLPGNDELRQDLSPKNGDDLPTSTNVDPELSRDIQEAEELPNSTIDNGSVDTSQSSPPDGGPGPPQTVPIVAAPEQASASLSEPETPDQANTPSVTDESSSACLSNMEEHTPEVMHPSETVPTEEHSEAVINDPLEERADLKPVMNETPLSDSEGTESSHLCGAEQLPIPVSHNPDMQGESIHNTDDSASGVHSHAKELEPITFEDLAAPRNSALNDDIPIAHAVLSPVNLSVELDISASASPSSSSRSVFSDSPFSNRPYHDFHLVSPMSPDLCLDGCNMLLFCDGKLLAEFRICAN
jgi:hypothetical protein